MITIKNVQTSGVVRVWNTQCINSVISKNDNRAVTDRYLKSYPMLTLNEDGTLTLAEGWEVVTGTRKPRTKKDSTKHDDAGEVKTKAPKQKRIKKDAKDEEKKDEKKYEHPAFQELKYLVQHDRQLGRSPWLFGPAGSGKSTLCEAVAKDMNLPFYSVSSLQQKYELEGYTDAAGEYVETTFYKAAKEGASSYLTRLRLPRQRCR